MKADRKRKATTTTSRRAASGPAEMVRRSVALIKEVFPDEELKIDVQIDPSEYILVVEFMSRGLDKPLKISFFRSLVGEYLPFSEFPSDLIEFMDDKFLRIFKGFGDILFGESREWMPPPSPPAEYQQEGMGDDDFDNAAKKAKASNTLELRKALAVARYEVLARHVDLLNPRLSEAEKLTRAERLYKAYARLRRAYPDFRDTGEQLRAANRIRMAAYRRRKIPRKAAQAALG